jgi:hypothetical protein
VPMDDMVRRFPVRLTSVNDYARRALASAGLAAR